MGEAGYAPGRPSVATGVRRRAALRLGLASFVVLLTFCLAGAADENLEGEEVTESETDELLPIRPFFINPFDRAFRALPSQFQGARQKNREPGKKILIYLLYEPVYFIFSISTNFSYLFKQQLLYLKK